MILPLAGLSKGRGMKGMGGAIIRNEVPKWSLYLWTGERREKKTKKKTKKTKNGRT